MEREEVTVVNTLRIRLARAGGALATLAVLVLGADRQW